MSRFAWALWSFCMLFVWCWVLVGLVGGVAAGGWFQAMSLPGGLSLALIVLLPAKGLMHRESD